GPPPVSVGGPAGPGGGAAAVRHRHRPGARQVAFGRRLRRLPGGVRAGDRPVTTRARGAGAELGGLGGRSAPTGTVELGCRGAGRAGPGVLELAVDQSARGSRGPRLRGGADDPATGPPSGDALIPEPPTLSPGAPRSAPGSRPARAATRPA